MTTNSIVLLAVAATITVILFCLAAIVTYRFRSDRAQLVGGSILEQAVQDVDEDARAHASRVEVGIEAFRTRRHREVIARDDAEPSD